ncbi:hypothetical protein F8388_022315 [Cannabis sativa]|uniref:RNase H type-1 domain-containing protein n=1 Tax=Cannabis sativa TaxID=3483 RepID=A0A7J6E9F2_CANSA|nr:hypothetical protein F8388_022315 [Cannabis sativa]
MTTSSPNILPQQPHDLNQPTIPSPSPPNSGFTTAITSSSSFHMSPHHHISPNININHSAPVTTAEQLQASIPKASFTTTATVVATSYDNHHVIPVSQAFSTILADLNPTQPPQFAIGTASASTPKTNLSRKARLGLRKSIGDGTTVSIFNDAWIPGYGKLHYLNHSSYANMTVANLFTSNKEWNLTLLQTIFPVDLWNCRNNWIYSGLSSSPSQVLHWVEDYLDQYQSCNTGCSHLRSSQDLPSLTSTDEPCTHSYRLRLSTDAAQDVRANKMGFGMVLQSNQGEILLTLATPWIGLHQPLLMEAHALHYALSWCHSHSLAPDSIVSDCKGLVDYICNKSTHHIHLNKFVIPIFSLLSYFPNAFISYIPREANEMAHSLAKKALGLEQEALWTNSTLTL